MAKKFSKILAVILALGMIATLCAVPMSVSATPSAGETYDAYDVVTYRDLLQNGNPLTASRTSISGNPKFAYNRTSPSYSVVLKYRWTAGSYTSGKAYYVFYFDKWGGSAYPFALAVKSPGFSDLGAVAGENGAWHLYPSQNDSIVQMSEPIVAGNDYDIEHGRLKVVSGENTGKYYVYVKVNGELIYDYYYDGDNGNGTYGTGNQAYDPNYLRFTDATSDNYISAIPEPDVYDDYDEVYYSNLKVNGSAVADERSGNGQLYTYNKTSASGSAILKLRWKNANPATEFQISFDKRGSNNAINYMFGVQLYKATTEYPNGRVWLRPGYGPSVAFTDPIESGENYDIEFARLKVVSGDHAGKYYMYFKLNDVLIAEDYFDASVVDSEGNYTSNPSNTVCSISNEIYITFWGGGGATITNPAYTETYDDYDEVTYYDLLQGGNPVTASRTALNGNPKFAYNRNSPSYSVVFKYRWTAGSYDSGKPYYVFYFDKWGGSAYPFALAVKSPGYSGLGAAAGANGAWHLYPSQNDSIVQMSEPIVAGNNYDIEHGRLKVVSGPNAGKYYVFVKVNGEMIYDYYYDGDNGNGTYGSGNQAYDPAYLRFTDGTSDNYISEIPIPETYDDYDEIGYADLLEDGIPLPLGGKTLSGANGFTYNRTSASGSAIIKYRWKVGSQSNFQLSFDKNGTNTMSYMFGAKLEAPHDSYTNGDIWVRPSYGTQRNMPFALLTGTSHNIEFARLKVLTGRNTGKYYVYLKIDDVLIDESYVAADVVDSNGDYTSNNGKSFSLSNVIQMNFWGSNNNGISKYYVPVEGHLGTVCDFDENGVFSATDIADLVNLLIGNGEFVAGMGDFDNNGNENIIDLISLKKHLIKANTHTKSGSLTVGTQEHILEDATKTAEYIADASAALGAGIYRLSRPIHTLYSASVTNAAVENTSNMAAFEDMVDALIDAGITEILYVSDTFVPPYDYYDSSINHHKTVPDPSTESEYYEQWLEANSNAYAALAAKFQGRIKYFEPFNEINTTGTRFEKSGANWNATSQQQAACKYTVSEKAGIIADLCWNISTAVKSVDKTNQVTTPSICTGSNAEGIETSFTNTLYNAIESGAYPSNKNLGDMRVDNFFTIVNLHIYPQYGLNASQYNANLNTAASDLTSIYGIACAHGDGGSRFWITETGVSTGDGRTQTNCGDMLYATLNKFDTSTTFIDTVIIYKLADMSTVSGGTDIETAYGLFYSGDNSGNPYGVKETAKAVYRFTHGGSTNYSALNSLVAKYN